MAAPSLGLPSPSELSEKQYTVLTGQTKTAKGRKVKRDGSILRSKDEICKDYDTSSMPYPIKNLVKLDYCWKLNATLWWHSMYVAVPVAGSYFVFTRMPACWSYTRKTFPLKALALTYIGSVVALNAVNTTYSLIAEDYCKRNSKIYDTKQRNAYVLRDLIRDTNTTHKKTLSGKANTSLSEEEIINLK